MEPQMHANDRRKQMSYPEPSSHPLDESNIHHQSLEIIVCPGSPAVHVHSWKNSFIPNFKHSQ